MFKTSHNKMHSTWRCTRRGKVTRGGRLLLGPLLGCGRSLREGVVGRRGAGGDRTSQWIGLSVRQIKTLWGKKQEGGTHTRENSNRMLTKIWTHTQKVISFLQGTSTLLPKFTCYIYMYL